MPCAHDWPFREMRWRVRRQIHISGEMLESRQTRWNVLEYERGGTSGGDVTQHWVLVTEETTVQAESAGLTLPGHTHINTVFNRDVRKFICTNKRRLLLLAGPEGRLCFRCVHLGRAANSGRRLRSATVQSWCWAAVPFTVCTQNGQSLFSNRGLTEKKKGKYLQ